MDNSQTDTRVPIRAVIFDLFGVLVQPGWGIVQDKFSPSPDQWREIIGLSHACDRGIISVDVMVQQFAVTLGAPEGDIWSSLVRTRKNILLLDYLTQVLRPRYKLAVLSNIGSGLFSQYLASSELAVFDKRVASADIGFTKPDPQAYTLVASQLSTPVDQCLFVDDSQANIQGALDVGMRGHLYDPDQWLDLSSLSSVLIPSQ